MGKRNGGFSLLETMVAIVILGAMVVPTCTALVMSIRINDKTEKMLQAQLAVSSAVETLMADGVKVKNHEAQDGKYPNEYDFSDVDVLIHASESKEGIYYAVTVTSEDGEVSVNTTIRAATPEGGSTP